MLQLPEERLRAYEAMQKAVQEDLADVEKKMERQKAVGKVRSATYNQLMGRKLMLQKILGLYEIYDLR